MKAGNFKTEIIITGDLSMRPSKWNWRIRAVALNGEMFVSEGENSETPTIALERAMGSAADQIEVAGDDLLKRMATKP